MPRSTRPPKKGDSSTRGSRKSTRSSSTRSTPKKTDSSKKSSSRSRKQPSGGVLSGLPVGSWSWRRLSLDRKLDIVGVFLALLGLLTLLSLLSPQNGKATGWLVTFVNRIAGYGSFILPGALVLMGVWLVLRNVERLPLFSAERVTGIVFLYLNVLSWLHLLSGGGWEMAKAGLGGGYLGAIFEGLLVSALGPAGAIITLSAWLLISVALLFDVPVSEMFAFLQRGLANLVRRLSALLAAEHERQTHRRGPVLNHPLENLGAPLDRPSSSASPEPAYTASAESDPEEDEHALPPGFVALIESDAPVAPPGSVAARHVAKLQKKLAAEIQPGGPETAAARASASAGNSKDASPAPKVKRGVTPPAPPWKVPDITDILDPGTVEAIKSNQEQERGKLIEDTLISFGTPVRVVEIHRGPTVTQFGVEPLYIENRSGRTRVRVSKIVSLADDLALALAAPRIRIQAPVPGRSYVGIEVPNLEVSRVVLRDVMETDAFKKLRSPLRFALGKDVAGHPKVYDLAGMPHLLIAGTTGSGKSVLVNALLSCLLLNNTPNELRMILVDPKRVELTGYNGVPHLLAPVIVEAEEVVGALHWVQREMDARYHRFSQMGARNIVDYNKKTDTPLPYMLVLIDELADLMMLAPDETERSLTRLAQLARATGIHLVLATQRPSVDVVTGLIKANFPARVAFAVASGTDSRVILDQPGAERLLGRGDMLFQAPDAAAPVRIQGVFVSDPEIQRLVDYWRTQAFELRDLNTSTPTAVPINMDAPANTPLKQTPLWEEEKPGDPLEENAINIVRQEGKASISMLQRKLRIGYTRSARLIDSLEEKGIIGPSEPTSQVRQVLDMGESEPTQSEEA